MPISIKKEHFGKTKNGKDVNKYTFEGGKTVVSVLDFGCAVSNILVPDRKGKLADISLGYDDVAGYEKNFPYIGVAVGRVAGRIAGGKFTLDGKEYKLDINNGPNNIHGGITGLSRRLWKAEIQGDKLKLKYVSPDGEEGFPGEVTTEIMYSLTQEGALTIDYTATTTKPCPVNLTNHSYFNLKGHDDDDVMDHVVQINADSCVPLDDDLIPTGELPDVSGTPNDLRSPVRLGDRESEVRKGNIDLTYCVGDEGELKYVSRISHPPTGRYIDTHTTEPGLQFYTAKYMTDAVGKGGKEYKPFASFCLETQRYPDSVNHSNFPNTILRPGYTYRQTTVFTFGVLKG
ncbi:galactose mutarotase-like [Ruditapes philippinarum]|uniref:galactose mutarotase-like n=1 Tax=Ruditapes philippinarum TaxID=129788 RepID=UPI00295B8E11|nr:galactose mutarotase-like [Ruditapes philippinarum]